mgnify:CR=1 FL=1|tara:strand:- start:586 stop:1131 length:546 start_codon:yes stop_codon:yes gene_type:complete
MVDLKAVLDFAVKAHEGQKRKYTQEDYIVHPLAVCRLVSQHGGSLEQQAAALLHDVVEDCDHTIDDIRQFGDEVTELVEWLTDTSKPEDGNRAVRKGIDRQRLSEASAEAQFVKLADMIDNSKSIFAFDRSFAPTFKSEMAELVKAMTKVVGSSLWLEAKRVLKDGPLEFAGDYSLRRSEV